MGVAVVMEPDTGRSLDDVAAVWGLSAGRARYGGWWQADPTDNSVLIFLAHNMLELHQMARGIGLGVWSAIARVPRTRVRMNRWHGHSCQ